MLFNQTQNWHIPHTEIILDEKLTSGRFADIYKARRETKRNDQTLVVAKLIKGMLLMSDIEKWQMHSILSSY